MFRLSRREALDKARQRVLNRTVGGGVRLAPANNRMDLVTSRAVPHWFDPALLATLHRCQAHNVIRSNYSAHSPNHYGEYPTHYKSLDAAVRAGLIMRVGRYYRPTSTGAQWT